MTISKVEELAPNEIEDILLRKMTPGAEDSVQ
jgi:hypothetical protein